MAGAAMALEVGEVKSGYAELNGRQVPLPVGDWVVAGKGRNQVVSGISGAYGSIDNVVLMQVQGQAVRGVNRRLCQSRLEVASSRAT